MSNIIEIGFGNDKSRSKKNQTTKIYNQGNIVLSRPQSSKNPYQILSIKKYKSSQNFKQENKIPRARSKTKPKAKYMIPHNKNTESKPMKKTVKEMHEQIHKEIDEMDENEELKKNIGYILRNSFTSEELKDNFEFGPSPKRNRNKLLNQKNGIPIKQKLKPYIPVLEVKDQNVVNERYLQRTINIYKDNERFINKINNVVKNSKFVNEEKIKEDRERKKMKIDKEKQQIRNFIDNKRKEIRTKNDNDISNNDNKDDIKINNFIFTTEDLKADNLIEEEKLKNKNKKEDKKEDIEENEKKEIQKEIKKSDKNKKDIKKNKKSIEFIKITDMAKDQKYIDAEIRLKRTKEDCEKAKELAMEIDQKIREDKKLIKIPEYITTKKQKEELELKAKKIIESVKLNIDIHNFKINQLNKEDQKLMKGGKRYDPNNKEKSKVKNIKIDQKNEPILLSSINSVKEIKEINKDFNNIFKKRNDMDEKEKNASQKWKNDNERIKAYINNLNKAKKIDINKVKKEKNIDLEDKKDICNYMYMPKEYEKHWYNNKDTKDKTEYRHPFLIYDD